VGGGGGGLYDYPQNIKKCYYKFNEILITTLRFCPKKQYINFKRKRRMHAAENPRVAVKISAKIKTWIYSRLFNLRFILKSGGA
jgi:hypothetical protein